MCRLLSALTKLALPVTSPMPVTLLVLQPNIAPYMKFSGNLHGPSELLTNRIYTFKPKLLTLSHEVHNHWDESCNDEEKKWRCSLAMICCVSRTAWESNSRTISNVLSPSPSFLKDMVNAKQGHPRLSTEHYPNEECQRATDTETKTQTAKIPKPQK